MVELTGLLNQPAELAAPQLLGSELSAHGVTVRIVEVEAYGGVGEDPASHAFRGQTTRNSPMFGPPGTLYVYFTYGMHWCVNLSCLPAGQASAILLRAGEVVSGIEIARQRSKVGAADIELARGPARLARALGLTGVDSGTSTVDGSGPAQLKLGTLIPSNQVANGPRVGISTAAVQPWRFWISDAPQVSRYQHHKSIKST